MLLLQNIFILVMVYAVRMLIPLLAIPILARTISESDYGVYMYAIAFSAWVSIFIEYGFNISSTRDIASGRPVLDTVAGTQSAKIILVGLTIPLLILSVVAFPVFSGKVLWASFGWLSGVLAAFSPIYYFQGKERLWLVGVVETLSGGLLLGGILLLIKRESDAGLLPYILLVSRLLGPFLLTLIMSKETGFRLRHIAFSRGVVFLKSGFDFFIFQAVVSLYTSFNVIFLGFFCSPIQVGIYASAEKVMRAGLGFIGQASNAIFPRISALKTTNFQEMKKLRRMVLMGFGCVGVLGMFLVWGVSPYVARYFFGGRVVGVDAMLNIMACIIPAIALSNVLGFQYLVVDRKEKAFNKIVVVCAMLSLPLSYLLVKILMAEGMAYAWMVVEWTITLSICFSVFKFKNSTFA